LFGPTDPIRWRPLGEIKVLVRSPLDNLPASEVAKALAELEFPPKA